MALPAFPNPVLHGPEVNSGYSPIYFPKQFKQLKFCQVTGASREDRRWFEWGEDDYTDLWRLLWDEVWFNNWALPSVSRYCLRWSSALQFSTATITPIRPISGRRPAPYHPLGVAVVISVLRCLDMNAMPSGRSGATFIRLPGTQPLRGLAAGWRGCISERERRAGGGRRAKLCHFFWCIVNTKLF